jgi:hypothetical protein
MRPDETIEVPISLSLAPYTGPWTKEEAAHLLRRTLFGPTLLKINNTVNNGMESSVNQLITIPNYSPPLCYDPVDTIASLGNTWVNSLYPSDPIELQQVENARRNSLGSWKIQLINNEDYSIHQKMCLFWQNHFAVSAAFDSRATYDYHELISANAFGNFKQLVKDMTINPSMLVFLNGAQNNRFSPNENFAREILELYTLGKGPQIGEGDYSNYTEADVQAGAKIFTGWTIQNFLSDTITESSSYFDPFLHDTSDKTLSGYFGNQVVTNADENEYSNYIDIIFQHPQTAKHICRKLYRWFVNYDLSSDVENTIISEMADILTTNNFEILPVLSALLKSEHFYDMSVRGAIIKNPIEYTFSILNSTNSTSINLDININYRLYLNCYWTCEALGMSYFLPPSVGGWTAYYQAPNFTKLWINSSYIKLRFDLASYLTLWGGINVEGNRFPVDHFGFLNALSVPSDAPQVIEDMVTVFCPKGLSSEKKIILKSILTNGLPDFEWTLQYNEYLADPTNTAVSDPVKLRVALTLDQLFKYPEFQTI